MIGIARKVGSALTTLSSMGAIQQRRLPAPGGRGVDVRADRMLAPEPRGDWATGSDELHMPSAPWIACSAVSSDGICFTALNDFTPSVEIPLTASTRTKFCVTPQGSENHSTHNASFFLVPASAAEIAGIAGST